MIQRPLPAGLPETPEEAFRALMASAEPSDHPFWLDSGPIASDHGRFHHLSAAPSLWLSSANADPRDLLKRGLAELEATRASLPRPAARLVAAFDYDTGHHLDHCRVAPGAPVAEAALGLYPACVSYDHAGNGWVTAESESASTQLMERLGTAIVEPPPAHLSALRAEHDAASYGALVRRIQEAIRAGDVYQVNLSQCFDAVLSGPAWALYVALRRRRPAPWGAYLDLGPSAIVSNSPECLLDVDGDLVRTWPLKGTRARRDGDEDVTLAELLCSEKDAAEHVMIVDLLRNDLGRIAVPGSVRVTSLMHPVRHPTVVHLESTIEARRRPECGLPELFAAVFPGGSITGAPKLAAIDLIAELEGERRGVYCGALGYVDADGVRSKWAIPIRTATVDHASGRARFRSGGGVVIDSDPSAEYEETLVKARAFLELAL
ncbi:MAG: anthranilate synthase component I family protein [Myxococcales bacterium]|nr:anthranilate synthase component I family protein [Myxococcales bacterium]